MGASTAKGWSACYASHTRAPLRRARDAPHMMQSRLALLRSSMRENFVQTPGSTSHAGSVGDDLHAAMAKLIRTDYGELIWRDRSRFAPIAASVSPTSGRTYLYDAVAGGKLSAAKWLVRLGGRVREPQAGNAPHPSPWQAALSAADPLPMLRVLLTSEGLTPSDLGLCADDLLALSRRASSRRDVTAAHDAYCDACGRAGREPGEQLPPSPTFGNRGSVP
jgi:hypothetical protein